MQINNISNSQPQFNGALVLHCVKRGGKDIACQTISTDGLVIERAEKAASDLTNSVQTLIKTQKEGTFGVSVPYETVMRVYREACISNMPRDLAPASEYSTPGFFG